MGLDFFRRCFRGEAAEPSSSDLSSCSSRGGGICPAPVPRNAKGKDKDARKAYLDDDDLLEYPLHDGMQAARPPKSSTSRGKGGQPAAGAPAMLPSPFVVCQMPKKKRQQIRATAQVADAQAVLQVQGEAPPSGSARSADRHVRNAVTALGGRLHRCRQLPTPFAAIQGIHYPLPPPNQPEEQPPQPPPKPVRARRQQQQQQQQVADKNPTPAAPEQPQLEAVDKQRAQEDSTPRGGVTPSPRSDATSPAGASARLAASCKGQVEGAQATPAPAEQPVSVSNGA